MRLLKGGMGALLLATLLALLMPARAPSAQAGRQAEPLSAPLLAYYYIWFDTASWNRAKTDYPLLGRYSSDDVEVMRQHVRWAKQVGINGFIVSWKDTERLSPRLAQLAAIAAEEEFKLVIIYQGLDFYRDPLPVQRIAEDLDTFTGLYSDHPAFDLFGSPVVIWSGSWEFSREEVASVVEGREELLVLASEKNVAGYERLADLVDGNAYYWSSVNPDTYPGYPDKLIEMAGAVHARGGVWIAPAAPGFDARLIGGSRVIPREGGAMLRRQLEGAAQSAPDAIGLISWNEFSENSHIEPSEQYGMGALEVVAEIQGRAPPVGAAVPERPPAAPPVQLPNGLPVIGGGVLLFVFSLAAIVRHRAAPTERAGPPRGRGDG